MDEGAIKGKKETEDSRMGGGRRQIEKQRRYEAGRSELSGSEGKDRVEGLKLVSEEGRGKPLI